MHDEDSDRELFSNDAREPFGPPSFAAAAFQRERLVVHARYGM